MPVEKMPSGGVVITGASIEVARYITLASACAMKINNGMELTRISAIQAAKNLGILPHDKRGNVKTALLLTIAKLEEIQPGYEPSPQIARALATCKKK